MFSRQPTIARYRYKLEAEMRVARGGGLQDHQRDRALGAAGAVDKVDMVGNFRAETVGLGQERRVADAARHPQLSGATLAEIEAVIGLLDDSDPPVCIKARQTLTYQNLNLPQLRHNLFRPHPLVCHSRLSVSES